MEGYLVRRDLDWQHFCIEERTGLFYSQGSYGTYAYCWSHIGERTLKEFLSGLTFSYFMGKCAHHKYKPDVDKTLRSMKEHVIYVRREQVRTKEEAREVYDLLKGLEDEYNGSVDLLLQHLYGEEIAIEVLGDDLYEFTSYSYSSDCVGFWEHMWPKFLDQISPPLQKSCAACSGEGYLTNSTDTTQKAVCPNCTGTGVSV